MKIKTDFVTNSSSSSFILSIHPKMITEFEEYCERLDKHESAVNEGITCYFASDSLQDLKEYTTGRPADWASKPRGIIFENISEETFDICKKIIRENSTAVLVWIDYGAVKKFRDDWEDNIIERG